MKFRKIMKMLATVYDVKPSFEKHMHTSSKFRYYVNYPSQGWAEVSCK